MLRVLPIVVELDARFSRMSDAPDAAVVTDGSFASRRRSGYIADERHLVPGPPFLELDWSTRTSPSWDVTLSQFGRRIMILSLVICGHRASSLGKKGSDKKGLGPDFGNLIRHEVLEDWNSTYLSP